MIASSHSVFIYKLSEKKGSNNFYGKACQTEKSVRFDQRSSDYLHCLTVRIGTLSGIPMHQTTTFGRYFLVKYIYYNKNHENSVPILTVSTFSRKLCTD